MLMRSPLQGITRHPLRAPRLPSLTQLAIAILRKFGTNAHVYIPGAGGVAVSGLPTNNYTLSDGSTGYSAVDGTAGLVLDAAGAVGAELIGDTGFDSDAYWQKGAGWSVSGSTAVRISSGSFSNINPVTNTITTAGKTYIATAVIDSISGGDLIFAGMAGGSPAMNTPGTKQFIFVASGVSVYLQATSGPVVATVSSFSIKEVTGIHATQSTTANKPALRRGLYNLLTYSNDLSNAAWTKSGGSISGVKFTPSAGSATYKTVQQNSTNAPATTPTTVFAVVEPAGYSVASIVLSGSNGRWVVDLSTSASTDYGGSGSLTIADVGSGRKLIAFAVTTGASVGAPWVGCQPTVSDPAIASTADGTSGINIYAIGMATGLFTAQQILSEGGIPLTTSTAASNSGAGRYSWQFDGSNDSLALVGANTGAQGVMIGAFRPNNAHFGAVICTGGDTVGNPGCGIGVDSTYRASFLFGDGTTTNQRINSGATTIVGAAHVISAVWGAASQKLRVDGNEVGSSAASVVPVSSGGISIGRIPASGDYFSGEVGPLIFINGTVSDADLLTLERWVASLTPNGPSF